ncbi:MAG: penicillin-binding transpeptidase domain-containing protein [FCB group bacterium]|jgi:cell division protein FtsI (penicillin-binding protein 3)
MNPEAENIEEQEVTQPKIPGKSWKFWLIVAIINLGFLAVVIRLVTVQVFESEKYKILAKKQQQAKITLRAERGNIYDRNGRLLASTVQGLSIAADPTEIDDVDVIAKKLEKILKIPAKDIKEKINNAKGSFVWLARGLMPGDILEIDSINDDGIIKIFEPRRNYLYAPLASQVVGCTGIDNKGLTGIELGWDSVLCGTSGYMMMKRDGTGKLHPSADLPVIKAEHGKAITLTIDIELQRIVEYELLQGIDKTKAQSATIIAIEPATGEILAMASYPSYNPYQMSNTSSGAMRNRSFTDTYEPGSTFKLITASAALDNNLITPTTMCDGHNGLLDFGKYQITDDHPIGKVPFYEAIEESSNIIFSQVGYGIPDNEFYKYIRDFGFGNTLGIDAPGEVGGKIKKPKEMTPIAKRFMSFGYGIAVTPLQMLEAYSTIANNGVMMKPFLVKDVYDIENDKTIETKPEQIRRVVSEKTASTLKQLLIGVVEKGTGKSAKIEGMNIAGKTGTCQKLVNGSYTKSSYMASFIGFFPVDNPKIVIMVLLDSPQGNYYGGSTAAPIFRNIALSWLSTSPGVNHKPETIKPSKEIKGNKGKKDTIFIPDLAGLFLKDAEFITQYSSLVLKQNNPKITNGIVISQNPKAGTKVSSGKEIYVDLISYKEPNGKDSAKTFIKPNVKGLILRRALTILHYQGIKAKVFGSGFVSEQIWSKENNAPVCTLICKEKNLP